VLFSDQFSTSSLDNWQSLASAPGYWVANDGRLQQRGATADGELSDDNAVLLIKGVTFDNGTFQAQVYPSSGSPLGLVFKGSDAGYYRLTLFQNLPSNSSMALLEKVTSDKVEQIASAPHSTWPGYKPMQWQLVQVTAKGNQITASVDGVQLFSATDATYASGWAGVWSVADRGGQFDNVSIQHIAGR
jgi:hypothetical protein